jgi:hypothetical protein
VLSARLKLRRFCACFCALFLLPDMRRVTFIDRSWLSPLSAKTKNVKNDMKTGECRFAPTAIDSQTRSPLSDMV